MPEISPSITTMTLHFWHCCFLRLLHFTYLNPRLLEMQELWPQIFGGFYGQIFVVAVTLLGDVRSSGYCHMCCRNLVYI